MDDGTFVLTRSPVGFKAETDGGIDANSVPIRTFGVRFAPRPELRALKFRFDAVLFVFSLARPVSTETDSDGRRDADSSVLPFLGFTPETGAEVDEGSAREWPFAARRL